MSYILLFFTSLCFISLRAFQQLNVQHDRYMWVPPVTLSMAVCEFLQITTIIKTGDLWAAVPMAAGGVLGCWFSMWFHKWLRSKKQ